MLLLFNTQPPPTYIYTPIGLLLLLTHIIIIAPPEEEILIENVLFEMAKRQITFSQR